MSDDRKNILANLADFASEVLDTNRDVKLSWSEIWGFIPKHAVEIVILTVDIVMLVAEYRVFDFGLRIAGPSMWNLKALGFVALSGLPFYLGQIMFLYPLAKTSQQFIAGLFVVGGLYMSATFGFADLSAAYDAVAIFKMVAWFTGVYIGLMLIYVLSDQRIQDRRLVAQTKATARYGTEQVEASHDILGVVEKALVRQNQLIDRFGEKAVMAQLNRFRRTKKGKEVNDLLPAPGQESKDQRQQKTYEHYTLDRLLSELGMGREEFSRLARGKHQDQVYQDLLAKGIERVNISRKNFKALVAQVQDGPPNV